MSETTITSQMAQAAKDVFLAHANAKAVFVTVDAFAFLEEAGAYAENHAKRNGQQRPVKVERTQLPELDIIIAGGPDKDDPDKGSAAGDPGKEDDPDKGSAAADTGKTPAKPQKPATKK